MVPTLLSRSCWRAKTFSAGFTPLIRASQQRWTHGRAAKLGTAFIACSKSSADQYHRDALFGGGAWATEMTTLISGRPARCLPNNFTTLKDAELDGLAVPDYSIAYDAGKALAAAAKARGEAGFGAQWAGQGALLARAMPAADLVQDIGRGAAGGAQLQWQASRLRRPTRGSPGCHEGLHRRAG
jgi:Nitronate monooxygenase